MLLGPLLALQTSCSTLASPSKSTWLCTAPQVECDFLQDIWLQWQPPSTSPFKIRCQPGNATYGNCWGTNEDLSTWLGVSTYNFHTQLLHMEELSAGKGGTIPESLGNLTELTYLNMDNNAVRGPIPKSIIMLTNMYHFSAFKSQLSGEIPPLPASLRMLNLGHTSISSGLENVCSMQSRSTIGIDHAALTGTIPACLGTITPAALDLEQNQLTGFIPETFGNFNELGLFSNQISGTVPANLSAANLYINKNQLSGTLPASIAVCGYGIQIDVSSNKFTGAIPSFAKCNEGNPTTHGFLTLGDFANNLFDSLGNVSALEHAFGLDPPIDHHGRGSCNFGQNPLKCPIPETFKVNCSANCI